MAINDYQVYTLDNSISARGATSSYVMKVKLGTSREGISSYIVPLPACR